MKKIHKGKIKSIKPIALDTFEIQIETNLKDVLVGQFISILCPPKTLRRPFSIAGFKEGVLKVIFKLKGEGTSYIKSLKVGDEIDFLGALGNGFKVENKKALLVGAGVGIAPMLFLKDYLNSQNIENFLISGFKAQNEVIEGSDENVVGGSVLDELEELILSYKPEVIYSCAPHIVLELLSKMGGKLDVEVQVAMEKIMACSIGVCRGCAIKLKDGDGVKNATICKDGPVFLGSEVIWE